MLMGLCLLYRSLEEEGPDPVEPRRSSRRRKIPDVLEVECAGWELEVSTILCVYTLSSSAHLVRVTHNRCWGRASPVPQDRPRLDVPRIGMRVSQRRVDGEVGYPRTIARAIPS